jgi:hypothetical protein
MFTGHRTQRAPRGWQRSLRRWETATRRLTMIETTIGEPVAAYRITAKAAVATRAWRSSLERDDFSSNRHRALSFCLSMIFSENR